MSSVKEIKKLSQITFIISILNITKLKYNIIVKIKNPANSINIFEKAINN